MGLSDLFSFWKIFDFSFEFWTMMALFYCDVEVLLRPIHLLVLNNYLTLQIQTGKLIWEAEKNIHGTATIEFGPFRVKKM